MAEISMLYLQLFWEFKATAAVAEPVKRMAMDWMSMI
jgi:hypothetical protein